MDTTGYSEELQLLGLGKLQPWGLVKYSEVQLS